MRKTLLFIVTFVTLAVISSTAWGATLITLGTQGRTNGPTEMGPTNYFHKSRRIQWVYTATEITAAGGSAGEIISIAFELCDDFATGDLLNYKVKMAQTTATNAAAHNTATLTTVKNAHTFPPGNVEGWRTIPFDQGFAWDGESNILVDISFGLNDGSMNNGRVWLYNENTPFEMRGVWSDTEVQENKETTMTTTGKPRAQLVIINEYVPVELSSFTATIAGEFVNIAWTSQTETQMLGYRVYRNTTADQSSAMLIDHPMVPATNTSETQTYNVVDNDVTTGTYYYWLEAVEYNTSNFHGPVSVTVTGNVPPVFPEVTSMKNAYPNPFKAGNSTNIEVSLKAGETGTLTIYNVMGQVLKTVSLNEGTHTVNWNGCDSKGAAVGSGIYFYKLSTPSLNQTKKMVIVK